MKLGRQRNYHKGRAAIRHYANILEPSFNLRFKLYSGHCTVMRMWGSIYPHISTTLTRVFLSLLNKVWRVESQFSLLVLFLCFNMLQQLGVFSQFREILTVVANCATDGAAAVRAVPQFFFNYYNEHRRRRDIRQLPPAANTPPDPQLHTGELRSQWSSWYFVSPQNKVIMPLLATAETATLHLTISINAPARRPPYITRQHDGDGSSPLQIFSVMYKYFRRWNDFSFTEFSCFSWLGWWVFRNCYWLNGKIIVVLLKITAGPHGPAKIIEEVEWMRAGMETGDWRLQTGAFND